MAGLRFGKALKISGSALATAAAAAGVLLNILVHLQLLRLEGWVVMVIGLCFIVSAGAGLLVWRGHQYVARANAEGIITGPKPHLLYLRTFSSDATALKFIAGSSEEVALAEVLKPFGELIAIGRPGERLPTPGAARIYTCDDEWKDVVKRRLETARLVVIRAAIGEHVLWELTQATQILNPQQLLILLLDTNLQEYEWFRADRELRTERATSRVEAATDD